MSLDTMMQDQNNKRKLKDLLTTKYCTACVTPLGFLKKNKRCAICKFRICNKCVRINLGGNGSEQTKWICFLCNGEHTNGEISSSSNKLYNIKPIKRSLSISNPTQPSLFVSRSNSPVLKSYTLLHPEDSQRHYYSLPRLNSNQKMSDQLEELYSRNRNFHYNSTLQPFITQNKFIEETFWDYYDMPRKDTNVNSNATANNLNSRSSRSSCERSLGETVDYQYSLKLSYSNSDLRNIEEQSMNHPIKPERKNRSKSLNAYDVKFSPLKMYLVRSSITPKNENKENLSNNNNNNSPRQSKDDKVNELLRKSDQILTPRRNRKYPENLSLPRNPNAKSQSQNQKQQQPSVLNENSKGLKFNSRNNLKHSHSFTFAPSKDKDKDYDEIHRYKRPSSAAKLEKPLTLPQSNKPEPDGLMLLHKKSKSLLKSPPIDPLKFLECDFNPVYSNVNHNREQSNFKRLVNRPELGYYSSLPTKAKLRKWNEISGSSNTSSNGNGNGNTSLKLNSHTISSKPSKEEVVLKSPLEIELEYSEKVRNRNQHHVSTEKSPPNFQSPLKSSNLISSKKSQKLPYSSFSQQLVDINSSGISDKCADKDNSHVNTSMSRINGVKSVNKSNNAISSGERLIKIEILNGTNDDVEVRQQPSKGDNGNTHDIDTTITSTNTSISNNNNILSDKDKYKYNKKNEGLSCGSSKIITHMKKTTPAHITSPRKSKTTHVSSSACIDIPNSVSKPKLLKNIKLLDDFPQSSDSRKMFQESADIEDPAVDLDSFYLDLDNLTPSSSSSSGSSSYLSNLQESYDVYQEIEQCDQILSEDNSDFEYKSFKPSSTTGTTGSTSINTNEYECKINSPEGKAASNEISTDSITSTSIKCEGVVVEDIKGDRPPNKCLPLPCKNKDKNKDILIQQVVVEAVNGNGNCTKKKDTAKFDGKKVVGVSHSNSNTSSTSTSVVDTWSTEPKKEQNQEKQSCKLSELNISNPSSYNSGTSTSTSSTENILFKKFIKTQYVDTENNIPVISNTTTSETNKLAKSDSNKLEKDHLLNLNTHTHNDSDKDSNSSQHSNTSNNNTNSMSKNSSRIFINSSLENDSSISSSSSSSNSNRENKNVTTVEINGSKRIYEINQPNSSTTTPRSTPTTTSIIETSSSSTDIYKENEKVLTEDLSTVPVNEIRIEKDNKLDGEKKVLGVNEKNASNSTYCDIENENDSEVKKINEAINFKKVNNAIMCLEFNPNSKINQDNSNSLNTSIMSCTDSNSSKNENSICRSSPDGQEEEISLNSKTMDETTDEFKSQTQTRYSPEGQNMSDDENISLSSSGLTPNCIELEALDLTSDDSDEWVHEDTTVYKQMSPAKNESDLDDQKPPLDTQLYTIVEESENESIADFRSISSKYKKTKRSNNDISSSNSKNRSSNTNSNNSASSSNSNNVNAKSSATSDLEKYFNFGPGILEIMENSKTYANEDSEFSDTFSESESSFCVTSELDEKISVVDDNRLVDPIELASNRLEKYFMNIGVGVQIQESDSVGSESESDLENRKKKKIKKHRRSLEFSDTCISDDELDPFGKEGLDTIKKTRRRKSSENLLNPDATTSNKNVNTLDSQNNHCSSSNSSEKNNPYFKIYSSDEEVNLMVSKLKELINKLLVKPTNNESNNASSTSNPPTFPTMKDNKQQIEYLESELIRLMKLKTDSDLKTILSSESDDEVYKLMQVVKNSTENSPQNSPALLAKVLMNHIGNRLSNWMLIEDKESSVSPSAIKSAQSFSSDLNDDSRFSWKGSFESQLTKRQSVGSQDSLDLDSPEFQSQDRSILRSSSLHHLANNQNTIKKVEEERITNSLPRLNQETQISRAQSLVIEPAAGPIKSARYRPPGFQQQQQQQQQRSRVESNLESADTLQPEKFRSESLNNISIYDHYNDEAKIKPQIRGRVEFGVLYNYKTSSLEIRIKNCEDLAAIDTKRNRSDPYCKIYLLPERTKQGKRKTKIKRNTLNPIFDETLKFPLSLSEVQNRTLWLSVWHNDIFGKNVFLGEVLINLKDRVFDDPNVQKFELKEMSIQQDDALTLDLIIALKWQPTDEESGTISILIKEAKNLPLKNGTPSTFIKCTLNDKRKQKTGICRKSFKPVWNETLQFTEVQKDESIEISLWNNDLLLNHHLIGTTRLGFDEDNNDLWTNMMSRSGFWVEGILNIQ